MTYQEKRIRDKSLRIRLKRINQMTDDEIIDQAVAIAQRVLKGKEKAMKKEKFFTSEEICEKTGVCKGTLRNFRKSLENDPEKLNSLMIQGGHRGHPNMYTQEALEMFQVWLQKNRENQLNSIRKETRVNKGVNMNKEENMYTSKEMCKICNVSDRTLESFNASDYCNSDCVIKGGYHNSQNLYSEKGLKEFKYWLAKNQANQGRSAVITKKEVNELVDENYKYSKEDICNMCDIDEKTFRRFRLDIDVHSKKVGKSHKEYFTEDTLKAFQAWLLKNQANQGRSSDTVKQTATDMIHNSLVAQELINSGNVAAVQEYCNMIMETTRVINNQNQQLLEQKPKVEMYKKVISTDNLYSMKQVVELLQLPYGRNTLFSILRDKGILNKNNMPYQKFSKYFSCKVVYNEKLKKNIEVTFATNAGLELINDVLKDDEEMSQELLFD